MILDFYHVIIVPALLLLIGGGSILISLKFLDQVIDTLEENP